MTLRVGIISAAWGAFAHLPAWRAIPGVEVTAICTSRQETAEAAAAKFQIARPFWNAEAMAADPDLDIIDCGTRPNLREAMVLAALRNGKHVYNGIPFAANLDGARALHQAWKDSGTVAICDAYSQWLPAFATAKRMIDDGFLGQPFGGSCTFNMSLFNQPHPHFPYNWFWQSGLGVSAVRNLGSHALHILVHLFGEIEEVVAQDTQLLGEWRFPDGNAIKPETNDFATMLIRFKSGMLLPFQVSWSATLGPGWSLEAFGSKGRIETKAPSFPTALDTTLRGGTLGRAMEEIALAPELFADPAVTITPANQPPPAYPMAVSMHNMVEAIRGNAQAAPDFEQAWYVERVQEAIRRSSEERRWVKVQEIA